MRTEALKLADELEALHQYVPSEAPAMIRRLVEELENERRKANIKNLIGVKPNMGISVVFI